MAKIYLSKTSNVMYELVFVGRNYVLVSNHEVDGKFKVKDGRDPLEVFLDGYEFLWEVE